MPVPLDHLGAQHRGGQPKGTADRVLHRGRQVRMGANRAAQFAHANPRLHLLQPLQSPPKLVIHQRQLQPKSDRFGMNAMAAANHGSPFEFPRAPAHHLQQFPQVFQQ